MTKSPFLSSIPLLVLVCFALAFPLEGQAADAPPPPEGKPVETLPPAEDLSARRGEFGQRNSPENIEALGKDFLSRTYVPDWDLREFNRPGGWETLKEVRSQIDGGDHTGALETFKDHIVAKLRGIESRGLPRGRFEPFSTGVVSVQWIRPLMETHQKEETLKQAQELMNGVVTVRDNRIQLGEPGTVNWKAITEKADRSTGWPWDPDAFYPLLAAYIYTGEQPYMEKWAAYVDDWSMNQLEGPGTTNIADIPDQWANGVETMLTLLRYLGGVANLPDGAASLPAPTFARVFSRIIDEMVPVSILYHRSNPQNWNDASLTALPDVGYFLEDFYIGRQLLQESRRRLDLLISTHQLPDATELDTTVGYSNLFIIGPGTFLNRVTSRQSTIPPWMLTQWEKDDWRENPGIGRWQQDVRSRMLKRARSLAGHIQANGEFPIGGTRNARRNESEGLFNNLHYYLPDAFQNPDIANIMAISTGRRADGVPSFTSERFPYGGHAYVRHGWNPKDPYLYMYAAPYPLSGSLSVRNNNAIGLSAFGHDLLVTGENGVYDQARTPVKVDGQDQHFPSGVLAWAHRGPMLTTSGYDKPADWRWHSSSQFNVVEGIYAGHFGRDKKIDDVAHQRMVHYVRNAGVWIVTDRLETTESHKFTLDWRFGVKPGHELDFTASQITVQPDQGSIKTTRPDGANISLHQFSSSPLTMTTGEERTEGSRLHDFVRVSNEWTSQDESIVVTAIYPRETLEQELKGIRALEAAGTQGFEAITPGGTRVMYQAASTMPGSLKIGDLSGKGESLLVATEPDGSRRGVALGCTVLLVGGRPVAIPGADFEFSLIGGKLRTMPVYRPLLPVEISPSDTTAFIGETAVTLASATPGSEIRYTLDGSDPTPASALYKAPLILKDTTTVKARSMRPGLTALPTTLSGTEASVVTEAVFDAATSIPRARPQPSVPGLNYEYYESRWQELLSGLNRLKPVKTGTVATLFDISNRGTAPVFAFKYTGSFEAPEDGIYNFHAPPEFYEPNVMAAYELRLSVAGKEWYPATSRQALGTWSIALAKGTHDFSVYYADMRADGIEKMNKPDLQPIVWEGLVPNLQLSGPGLPKGPVPAALLSRPQ